MVSKQSPSIGISWGKTTFQLSPSGKTVTAMFGGHLLTSFSSSLIAASSSAAVFEGFLGFEPATGISQLNLNQPPDLATAFGYPRERSLSSRHDAFENLARYRVRRPPQPPALLPAAVFMQPNATLTSDI
jgi:hypothetical protein